MKVFVALLGMTVSLNAGSAALAADRPSDPQIAHIAATADNIDIAAGKLALKRSTNRQVRAFASEMIRDHSAVNSRAGLLLKRLHVTPQANATSASLSKTADATMKRLGKLKGKKFDRAYIDNEVAYHASVNSALEKSFIPSATNPEFKSFLESGLTLFREHQRHAEEVAREIR